MKGKEKCKILKEIRAQIAAANEIAWVTEECPHKGECRGTCPKCEAEVRKLERELERRRALGKTVAVVGLSAGLIATTTACDALNDFGQEQVAGAMPAVSTTTSATTTLALTGDVDLSGVPMPPVTTVEPPEVGGEPAPRFYLSDFTRYEEAQYRIFRITEEAWLDDVIEEDGVTESNIRLQAGATLTVIGDDGRDWMYLVRYEDKLYAVGIDYLETYATELASAEDGAKK